MSILVRLLLIAVLILATTSAAFAQRAPNPPAPTNRSPNNQGSGLGGVIFGIGSQIIQNQINQPQRPVEPPPAPAPTAPPPPPPPAPPPVIEFREVNFPLPRPLLSLGRPTLIDAEFEPQVIVLLVLIDGQDNTVAELAAEYGLIALESDDLDLLGLAMVKFAIPPDQTVAEIAQNIAGDPRIIAQQPNYLFNIAQDGADANAPPTDFRPLQYAPEKLQLVAAHQATTGEGVTVGVIDTAIDITHPEFGGRLIDQSDVLGGEVISRGHGTAMSGLIAAASALDGVAPGVHLVSVRAFDATATGGVSSSSFALAKALDRMAASDINVLNLSFAGPRDPLILEIMDRLEELDMPVIAAAGNNGPDAEPVYPAAHRHAIAVTATDTNDVGFNMANLGMYIEVAAPGVAILSPQPDGDYDYETGTSAATAHVTGIVALMLARNPELTTADIRVALALASQDLGAPGRDEVFGLGLVDAALAVAAVEHATSE